MRELDHHERLRAVLEGISGISGEGFLRSLVRHLAAALQVRYAIVSECTDSTRKTVRTLAFWSGEGYAENIEYSAIGRPCELVMESRTVCHPRNVQALFPEDEDLVRLGVESYWGIPILGSFGDVIGHLAALDINPMASEIQDDWILRVFAARAGAEIERMQAEEALRQSQKLEAMGTLAGGVAHDFNNLLVVIMGHSEILAQKLGDHALRDNAEEIRKAATHASALTGQLLAFSRKQTLEPKVVDLGSLASKMDRMLKRLIPEDIEIVQTLSPESGMVKVDTGQIEQLMMNLVVNARDAMPEGGKLEIEVMNVDLENDYTSQQIGVRPGPYVMLAVTDTGCGMDAETRKRIFDPFFTSKERGRGTGLGLYTVYGIVQQNGGNITVQSNPGSGSRFKILLPRVEEAVADAEQEASLGRGTGTETVLLVEDEDVVRTLIRDVLRNRGYSVLEADHPREALRINEHYKDPIHLTLTDVVMPGMSGRELAERVMELREETKVLYISGHAADVINHHGVFEPGVAFLQKPFSPEALARKVREVLDGPLLEGSGLT